MCFSFCSQVRAVQKVAGKKTIEMHAAIAVDLYQSTVPVVETGARKTGPPGLF